MNYTQITLGELLSSENETIKRNAVSILKQLQKNDPNYCEHIDGEKYPLINNEPNGKMVILCGKCKKFLRFEGLTAREQNNH